MNCNCARNSERRLHIHLANIRVDIVKPPCTRYTNSLHDELHHIHGHEFNRNKHSAIFPPFQAKGK